MIPLLAVIGGSVALATSDVVTVTAMMRAMIYIVPLALVLRLYPHPRQWVPLKAALGLYACASLATACGASRDVVSLLSVVPAACLAWSVIEYFTRDA